MAAQPTPDGTNQRIAYYNGEFLPENEVRIPFRDHGFLYGDGVFDMTRTFGGTIFKLKEHVERLRRSLKAVKIDPGLSDDEIVDISEEVFRRNAHFLDETKDYWLAQRISRGVNDVGDEGWEQQGATVIVECVPLPLAARAPYYRDGIDLVVSPIRRTAPDALTPRAKTLNYLNLKYANMAVQSDQPNPLVILLDHNGNLAEGLGANLFIVRDSVCLTPREQFVLPGVSRQTVIDLAGDLGIEVIENDLDFHDAYTADEIFVTSTSMCIAPVRSFASSLIGTTRPGPMTERITKAYIDYVDFDWRAQYLGYLS